jgi:hypothetical protein
MDLAEAPELAIETGRPRLVSAESLTFKRVLCQRDPNAALAVSDAARREFIAVELQAGISIVVATQRFHDGQLYATYMKDLARADISIHEEMVADEDVIAALYSKEKQRTSEFVPEASRAIGVFRDVIEAATAYGAADVHWEYRDFAEDVELRLRVDGDLYVSADAEGAGASFVVGGLSGSRPTKYQLWRDVPADGAAVRDDPARRTHGYRQYPVAERAARRWVRRRASVARRELQARECASSA